MFGTFGKALRKCSMYIFTIFGHFKDDTTDHLIKKKQSVDELMANHYLQPYSGRSCRFSQDISHSG